MRLLKYMICSVSLDGNGVYPAAICRLQNRFVMRHPVAGRRQNQSLIKIKIKEKIQYELN
jgi:hypothetical protein